MFFHLRQSTTGKKMCFIPCTGQSKVWSVLLQTSGKKTSEIHIIVFI